MIKVDLSKAGLRIEVNGPEPIVCAEAEFMLKSLYSSLKEINGEESAKEMIRDLAENCLLSDAEQEAKHQKNKDTFASKMTSEFLKALFGGEADETD